MTQCLMTEEQVQQAFLAAPPYISKMILDLSLTHPSFLRDIVQLEEFPRGNGTIQEQIIFRGALPITERGFAAWKKLNNNTGCAPCDGPDCSYNWTTLKAHGLDRKVIEMMTRDFRSTPFCVKEIQTTAHYEQIFSKVVENLYAQVDYIKEENINHNALVEIAKKFVVDSGGAKPNTQNPYVYRNIGSARLSMLNIEMLEFFYEWMRKLPSAVPYDVVDGSPIFSMLCSAQLLSRLYRDDPELRQDARFSGEANNLLLKYNFMTTIRGMFIAAPILYPRRFNVVAGEPVEVFPTVNDVPSEVGAYTDFNPAYESATHEEVILHGKYPFKIFYMPTEKTLGQNTSFGPDIAYFNNWQWINPMTVEDPARRVGYFMTSATIGIAPQFSEAVFGILVERPSVSLMAAWLPPAACPPEDPTCDNEVPAVGCPCPLILGYDVNPIDGSVFINLGVPTEATTDDEVQFGIDTGGYLTGTVIGHAANKLALQVTFPDGTDLGVCDHFTTLFCDDTLGCYSTVLRYAVNCTDNTRLDLTLNNPVKAVTAAQVVTLTYGDGTQVSATVVSVDMSANLWVVDIGASAFCDNVGGVVSVCVPTSTDATCPGCDGVTYTECDSYGGIVAD